MKIVIVKLIHERSKDFGGSELGVPTGESYRLEGRTLDVRPFGFEGFASLDIAEEIFDSLTVGEIYEVDIRQHPLSATDWKLANNMAFAANQLFVEIGKHLKDVQHILGSDVNAKLDILRSAVDKYEEIPF